MLEGHPGVTPDTRIGEAEALFKVRSLTLSFFPLILVLLVCNTLP